MKDELHASIFLAYFMKFNQEEREQLNRAMLAVEEAEREWFREHPEHVPNDADEDLPEGDALRDLARDLIANIDDRKHITAILNYTCRLSRVKK